MDIDDPELEDELYAKRQKLKAAMHVQVARIAEAEEREMGGLKFSRKVVAAVNEVVNAVADQLGRDVEFFARHANRKTINTDDVMLCARRSEGLTEALKSFAVENELGAKNKQKKKDA